MAYVRSTSTRPRTRSWRCSSIARKFTVTKDSFKRRRPARRRSSTPSRRTTTTSPSSTSPRTSTLARQPDRPRPWSPSGKEPTPGLRRGRPGHRRGGGQGRHRQADGRGEVRLAFRDDYALISTTQAAGRQVRGRPGQPGRQRRVQRRPERASASRACCPSGRTSASSPSWPRASRRRTRPSPRPGQERPVRGRAPLRRRLRRAGRHGPGRARVWTMAQLPEPSRWPRCPPPPPARSRSPAWTSVITSKWAEIEKRPQRRPAAARSSSSSSRPRPSSGSQLPDDLATLLGKNLTLALDSEGLDSDQAKGRRPDRHRPGQGAGRLDKIEKFLAMTSGGQPPRRSPRSPVTASSPWPPRRTTPRSSPRTAPWGQRDLQDRDPGRRRGHLRPVSWTWTRSRSSTSPGLQGDDKANAQVLRAVGFSGTQTDRKPRSR